jgi:hypothetical protein
MVGQMDAGKAGLKGLRYLSGAVEVISTVAQAF